MQPIKYILFDFDGTMADTIGPALTIYNRVAKEYDSVQIDEEGRKVMAAGRPQDLLKIYNMSPQKLGLIMLRIRKEIRSLIPDLSPAPGIVNALEEIEASGFRLGILTSNSRSNVNLFLKNNGILHLFDFVYSGKSLFGKDKVFLRLFRHENIARDNVIYVGDETRDIEACHKVGIPIISVTWGLNNKEILSTLQPQQLALSPKEIISCINQIISQRI